MLPTWRHSNMNTDWSRGEVLKTIFPLLDGTDLALCMLVCRQWRDIASDEYFWKCLCVKRWPSIYKRPPPTQSYQKLFASFFKPHNSPRLPPRISFHDLEFYIDLWSEGKLIFSEAASGSVLQAGMQKLPPSLPEVLRAHLDDPEYKMIMQVDPSFTMPLHQTITISVLVSRRDTNKMACIMNHSVFDYVDGNAFRALAFNYPKFSPGYPFVSGIRAWVSLLFMTNANDNNVDVFGIEIDFCGIASTEDEVLWLLDMLDWK